MFFWVNIKIKLEIESEHLNNSYFERLKYKIKLHELKMHKIYGYVILIKRIINISNSKISVINGFSIINVTFEALVYHPIKGEVIDNYVSDINNYGIFMNFGIVRTFISKRLIPESLEFKSLNNCIVRRRVQAIMKKEETFEVVGNMNQDYLGSLED